MKLTPLRIAALFIGSTLLVASCSSKQMSGTDSNTHWLDVCTTSSDCGGLSCECGLCTKPCNAPSECGGLSARAVCEAAPGCGAGATVCLNQSDAGTPMEGGTCPADAVSGTSCDGRVAQCWTACTQGFRGQFVCSDGEWIAGHGLFPCGPDGGTTEMPAGPDAGKAGAAGSGGSAASGGAGGKAGFSGSGGAVGSGGSIDGGSSAGSDAGPTVSYSCKHSADCALAPTVCCPLCREPTLSERIAMNAASVGPYLDAMCSTAGACPPCVPPDGTITAVCKAGKCEAIDVQPYAACTKDADCKLVPKDCCACGPIPTPGWVSLSNEAQYLLSRCGTALDCASTCPGNPPMPPVPQDLARCNTAGGYCELVPGS